MTKTVGQRIEELAAAKGLPSGKALAKLFGTTYETMRKWRAGETAPNRARQLTISKVLEAPPEAFMHGVEAQAGADDLRLQRLVKNYRALDRRSQAIMESIGEVLNSPGAPALLALFGQLSTAPTTAHDPGPRTPVE